MKNIRLTENQIQNVIKESVKRILKEYNEYGDLYNDNNNAMSLDAVVENIIVNPDIIQNGIDIINQYTAKNQFPPREIIQTIMCIKDRLSASKLKELMDAIEKYDNTYPI